MHFCSLMFMINHFSMIRTAPLLIVLVPRVWRSLRDQENLHLAVSDNKLNLYRTSFRRVTQLNLTSNCCLYSSSRTAISSPLYHCTYKHQHTFKPQLLCRPFPPHCFMTLYVRHKGAIDVINHSSPPAGKATPPPPTPLHSAKVWSLS